MIESSDGDPERDPALDFRASTDIPSSARPALIDVSRPQEPLTYRYTPAFGSFEDALPTAAGVQENAVDQSSARGGLSQQPLMQPHSDATGF